MSLWHSLSQIGVNANGDWHHNRHTILCNRVSLVLAGFTLALFFVSFSFFGWILSVGLSLLASFVFLTPVLLNKAGYTNSSRLFLACSLSITCLLISVSDKLHITVILEEFQYFHFRMMMLCACIFPFILFSLEERKFWIVAWIVDMCCIIFYDPVHEFFNAGFYQLGFTSPSYYFVNYMTLAAAMVMSGSTYFLKFSFEQYEKKNEVLIKTLNQANTVISHQQSLLTKENVQLSSDLVEKNNQLSETNEELIQHNNELLQFSYSVSHNLRGPVASMLGLVGLIKNDNTISENRIIFDHLRSSIESLDSTIKDLNKIIDIRNKISKVKQPVSLTDEVNHITSLLRKEIDDNHIVIKKEFDQKELVYTVKHMLSSILYNLISNAIKYRSTERILEITISAEEENDYIRIDVSDNGIGLDVPKYKEKIFGLYKRFHTHIDGKGIGLFLVKLQTEVLGGKVDVRSILGKGTTFSIFIKSTLDHSDQILIDNEFYKLYFDAPSNAMVTIWKRDITKTEYEDACAHILDIVKSYHAVSWITDVTSRPTYTEPEMEITRIKFLREIEKAGIKRIAIIVSTNRMFENPLPESSITFSLFENHAEAANWLKS